MNRTNALARWLMLGCSVLFLSACGGAETPSAPTAPTAPTAPATTPSAPVPATPPARPAEPAPTPDEHAAAAADTTASTDTIASESAPAAPAPVDPPVVPQGPEPKLGTDYQIIDPPQLLAAVPGKVEVAEVFSYTCIHCARLEDLMPAWKASLPPQVNFVYAPMAHGAFEPIARAFYAAQAMGVLDKTHAGMFKALAEEHRIGSGKLDDVAKIYGELGVDPEALKATATSFAVNTQIARNQKAMVRWGIEGTPTLIVAGKYRVVATGERGHEGMLQTARWLAEKEIADQQIATH